MATDTEKSVLVDQWWEWSVTKALIASGLVGIGAVLVGLGMSAGGWLLIALGPILYVMTPNVQGPIA
jgi:hypothetical protein